MAYDTYAQTQSSQNTGSQPQMRRTTNPQQQQPRRTVRTRRAPPKQAPKPNYHTTNAFKFGLALWGENIKLLAADGRSEEIDMKYSGALLGYELGLKWTSWSIWTEAQALLLSGQASSTNTSIQYRDKAKGNIPFLFDAGFSYYPHTNVSLGLGAGLLFHSLTLEPPTSVVTTYEFKYSKPMKFFALFRLNWHISSNWSFEQKITSFTESHLDTGWNASMNYQF
ncbi:hypothetical protein [Pseudobdellovibrio exovorus]|uniref:hypothetical protein n=1 Tax=Pseudobdellovibrio exovorus TaxID=453816 RepID=UPI0011D1B963|nr:hypothetical protein [Pseudobdellovibrio exovorus]